MAQLTKKERGKLIKEIARESKVTLEAVARLSDEVLLKMATPEGMQFLADFKPAITYNRYKQGKTTERETAEARAEVEKKYANLLEQFTDYEQSEVLRCINHGKRVWEALRLKGKERFTALKDERLVHADDYNELRAELKNEINKNSKALDDLASTYSLNIKAKDDRIDTLKGQIEK